MRHIIRRHRGMVALYVANGIACAVSAALALVFFQRLVDGITENPSLRALIPLLAAYAAAALAQLVLNYIDEYPHNKLYHGIYQAIRRMALEKAARVDYASYLNVGTGRLVQMVENGAAAGRDIAFDFYLNIAGNLVPSAVASLVFIGAYDTTVMLAALGGYAVVFGITKLLLSTLYRIKEKILVSEEFLSRTYVRAFMELVVFRVHRRFAHELERADELSGEITSAHTRIKLVHELFFFSFALIVWILKLALVAGGIAMIAEGRMTIGVLLALVLLMDRVYEPIAIFNVLFVNYKLNRVAWRRFMNFWELPDDPGMTGGRDFALGKGELAFERVSFAYGETPILEGVSFTVPAGKTTAITGPSGAGKSTLAMLAMGLVRPQTGRVLYDGQDLSALDLNSVYRHIAYISQDAPVFDGTLRENICFDHPASDDDLIAVLKKAQLEHLCERHPQGLDTQVGERGVKLSGGEKQRLALARVFFHQPAIVILDEPTSALDAQTEGEVVVEMAEALRGRTILNIAHRLSTVRDADQIIEIKDGSAYSPTM